MFLSLSVVAVQQVYGEDWRLFAISLDGLIEEYYDRSSVTSPAAGVFQVTTKTIRIEGEETGNRRKGSKGPKESRGESAPLATTVTKHRIDCRNRVDTLLSTAMYDREGQLMLRSDEPWTMARHPERRRPQEIYPESVSESLIKMVCPAAP